MSPQRGNPNDNGADGLREPLLNDTNVDERLGASPVSSDIASIDSVNDDKDIVVRKCCKRGENDTDVIMRVNHNVFLNLLLSVLYGISNSLWNGTAYIAYLKKMGHGSNGPVGDIEAVSGLASLVCALPIGYLADKMGRSIVIRAGGLLLFVTSILQIGILEWAGTDFDDDDVDGNGHHASNKSNIALWLMGVIMVFWGLGDGVVNGPCQALYADSTPEGQRSMYFTYQFACYLSASAVGPLVSIVLFQTLGDDWDMYHLRLVIYAGLGMEVCNALLMMFFDDKKALDESENENEEQTVAENDDDSNNDPSDQSDEEIENGSPISSSPETTQTILQKRQEWIPYLTFIAGLISSLGSGMTVKFFPLFFKDEVGMSPSQVQVVYVLVPLVMVIMGSLCTKIASAGVGRVQTTALFEIGGISLLLTMVVFKKYLDVHPFLLVPIYVMRTSLMNATYPLQQSILMDFVPKDKRARWKSLDSVASFGWCGSAAFGGWVADKYDYTHTFLLTAIFQSVSLGVWCCLLPLVPRVEGSRVVVDGGEEQISAQTEGEEENCVGVGTGEENALTELSEPLL
eukprot:CAMPEP_0168204518 /NCGR_PEP_ID=MMETSP0139_2-20121125/25437_1 /TAXON_ID=44445 /ORGANISM="Pseudo-nitzschia australis, Strain 10249 10 AB" /LENGTH=571 /DNA_ID=CAMNT_0008130455 /DNA_START=53 /DNA_END=1768 /DNA_ORIENTATION=+